MFATISGFFLGNFLARITSHHMMDGARWTLSYLHTQCFFVTSTLIPAKGAPFFGEGEECWFYIYDRAIFSDCDPGPRKCSSECFWSALGTPRKWPGELFRECSANREYPKECFRECFCSFFPICFSLRPCRSLSVIFFLILGRDIWRDFFWPTNKGSKISGKILEHFSWEISCLEKNHSWKLRSAELPP